MTIKRAPTELVERVRTTIDAIDATGIDGVDEIARIAHVNALTVIRLAAGRCVNRSTSHLIETACEKLTRAA